jgi:hypothetical protein
MFITYSKGGGRPLVAFVGAAPSPLDVARGRHLSGRVGCTFSKVYAEPLGCPYAVAAVGDDVEELAEWLADVPVVVALGKLARQALGDRADLTVPHPAAVMRRGDSGEVGRKLKAVRSLVAKRAARKTLECAIAKADDEKRLVYGIVLEPDTVDLQGDTITVDTIEQAAHHFLAQSRAVGDMHSGPADAEVVESYLAPADGEMGGQSFTTGTWVMAVKVNSDALWKLVKAGEYTGFSIGGHGARRPA